MDCLLALVEHEEVFHNLLKSSNTQGIPFATASINVVMIVYEFLGKLNEIFLYYQISMKTQTY